MDSNASEPRPPDGGSSRAPGLRSAAIIAWRVLVIIAAIVAVAFVAGKLRAVLAPLAIGIFLAALVRPAVRFLLARGLPRIIAVMVPMFGLAVLVCGSLVLVAFSIEGESEVLSRSVQSGVDSVKAVVSYVEGHVGTGALDRVRSALEGSAERIPEIVAKLAGSLVSGVLIFLLACVYCFFFLLDLEGIARMVETRVSAETYQSMRATSQQIWARLEKYLGGITITAAANSLMFGLALLLIGVPLVVPNMVLTFIGSFVPYLGPITATAFATVLALGHSGLTDALLVIAAGAVVQAIEGNLLHPFVVGHAVSISPFMTLLAITSFGAVAGLIGALVAVPAAVVVALVFDAWRSRARVVTPG